MDKKRSKKKQTTGSASSAAPAAPPAPAAPAAPAPTDKRFASFETNPLYTLPKRRLGKTTLDERFSKVFSDKEFTQTARVDRYGRKLKTDARKKVLHSLYQKQDQDDHEAEDEKTGPVQESAYDPARQGGYSSSGEDSDSDVDTDEDGQAAEQAQGREGDGQSEVETGEVTRRIAVVNLDWDHISSVDIYALFHSFLPEGGSLEKVSIYPSEFGKQRMRREEAEGPPKELFQPKTRQPPDPDDRDLDSEEEDEQIRKELIEEGDVDQLDHEALRKYHLERLRYYYAVVVCPDESTAEALYRAVDGAEYLSSSNFLDLRFVPEDASFSEDEPRDEADRLPDSSYRPVEFVTQALQSSKVDQVGWDVDPREAARADRIKHAFSGSKKALEENDLRAYLASDDSESDGEEEVAEEAEGADDKPKLTKKQLGRLKIRQALGLGDEPTPRLSRDGRAGGPVGDMQVTFTSALAEMERQPAEPDHDDGHDHETTIERYRRRDRERQGRKREATVPDGGPDDGHNNKPDLGFDDPFFAAAEDDGSKSKSAQRKDERCRRREERETHEAETAESRAQAKRVIDEHEMEEEEAAAATAAALGGANRLDHFDMKDIRKTEKLKAKKGKKSRRRLEEETKTANLQEDFVMDPADSRFRAVFEDHQYAIDPSNPRFRPTDAMRGLLEAGRQTKKKRKDREGDDMKEGEGEGDDRREEKKRKKKRADKTSEEGGNDDLKGLVASIKRKRRLMAEP